MQPQKTVNAPRIHLTNVQAECTFNCQWRRAKRPLTIKLHVAIRVSSNTPPVVSKSINYPADTMQKLLFRNSKISSQKDVFIYFNIFKILDFFCIFFACLELFRNSITFPE